MGLNLFSQEFLQSCQSFSSSIGSQPKVGQKIRTKLQAAMEAKTTQEALHVLNQLKETLAKMPLKQHHITGGFTDSLVKEMQRIDETLSPIVRKRVHTQKEQKTQRASKKRKVSPPSQTEKALVDSVLSLHQQVLRVPLQQMPLSEQQAAKEALFQLLSQVMASPHFPLLQIEQEIESTSAALLSQEEKCSIMSRLYAANTQNLAPLIKNIMPLLHCTDEDRKAIALVLMQQHGTIAEYIDLFAIEEEKYRYDIACSEFDKILRSSEYRFGQPTAENVSKHLERYNLTNPEYRCALAEKAISIISKNFPENIQAYLGPNPSKEVLSKLLGAMRYGYPTEVLSLLQKHAATIDPEMAKSLLSDIAMYQIKAVLDACPTFGITNEQEILSIIERGLSTKGASSLLHSLQIMPWSNEFKKNVVRKIAAAGNITALNMLSKYEYSNEELFSIFDSFVCSRFNDAVQDEIERSGLTHEQKTYIIKKFACRGNVQALDRLQTQNLDKSEWYGILKEALLNVDIRNIAQICPFLTHVANVPELVVDVFRNSRGDRGILFMKNAGLSDSSLNSCCQELVRTNSIDLFEKWDQIPLSESSKKKLEKEIPFFEMKSLLDDVLTGLSFSEVQEKLSVLLHRLHETNVHSALPQALYRSVPGSDISPLVFVIKVLTSECTDSELVTISNMLLDNYFIGTHEAFASLLKEASRRYPELLNYARLFSLGKAGDVPILSATGVTKVVSESFAKKGIKTVSFPGVVWINELNEALSAFYQSGSQKGVLLVNFTKDLNGHYSPLAVERSGDVLRIFSSDSVILGAIPFTREIVNKLKELNLPTEIYVYETGRQTNQDTCYIFSIQDILEAGKIMQTENLFDYLKEKNPPSLVQQEGVYPIKNLPLRMMRMTQSLTKMEQIAAEGSMFTRKKGPTTLRQYVDEHCYYGFDPNTRMYKRFNLAAVIRADRYLKQILEQVLSKEIPQEE